MKCVAPIARRKSVTKSPGHAPVAILLIALWSAPVWSSDATPFDFGALDRMLGRYVDSRGWVDYAGIKAEPTDLRTILMRLREASPESHPAMFPERDDRLAYWLNAYNALVIAGVVNAYPATSVRDIHPQPGFFKVFHVVGGKSRSLDDIEHNIIRKEFGDPRIHAALNCGAASCPRLRPEVFLPDRLDEQLDAAVREFIRDPQHVRLDSSGGTLVLSKILDWFGSDFTDWYKRVYRVDNARITDYLSIHLAEEDRAYLRSRPQITIKYLQYDWTLNDRALHQDAIR
ncbi:MAG: DUF547 domain-containing protein [Gemmatimonadota bacterium]|nr:DUF547 domain-containing protein [Gemmatimonadota bacterium]